MVMVVLLMIVVIGAVGDHLCLFYTFCRISKGCYRTFDFPSIQLHIFSVSVTIYETNS